MFYFAQALPSYLPRLWSKYIMKTAIKGTVYLIINGKVVQITEKCMNLLFIASNYALKFLEQLE